MRYLSIIYILIWLFSLGITTVPASASANALTYYVSSSSGLDTNTGLSQIDPFATVSKVNTLSLQPGDRVLFKCGDIWRADQMILNKSGTQSAPIEFNSYPAGCANKPVLSGSRGITGWVVDSSDASGKVYQADLPAGVFPLGIDQLFRSGQRLTMGRWPNLDAPNAGYAFVDAHSANSNQITDNDLPALNWTGAIVHIKNIRWSMLDRQVTGSSSHKLTLNTGLSCLVESWAGCTGWGYFINNSRNTLDEDGEWYYDPDLRRVYLYSSVGTPADMEGSVVLVAGDGIQQGGIMLSSGSPTAYVIIDNLAIINWFNDGISTPKGGMQNDIYHDITVRNVVVKDVDGVGINLSSWLQNPTNGRLGLLGGKNLVFSNDLIDGANAFGVSGYFAASTFEDNTIMNIALVKNLGKSGMGCGITTGECTENGDGFRIRTYNVLDSGYGNTLRYNRFVKTGYNGVDVFGPETTLEDNFITQACYTKADCGAVRVFGDTSLAATNVYNIHLIGNIIVDIPGNVDGCEASRAAFGMGLYIDNFSKNVEARDNTVISTTVSGILYQQSSGTVTGNTVYNASSGTEYSAQIDLGGSATQVTMSGNVLYGLKSNAWTLYASGLGNILSSDYNYIFHPYVSQNIAYGPSWTRATFAQWQAYSGQEAHSKTNWFTQPTGEASRAKVFYNDTRAPLSINLGSRQYLDLDYKPVVGSLILQPFTSKVLVDNGAAPLTLISIAPGLSAASHAADFTLTVSGTGFTPSSVVRWNGGSRSTVFVSSTTLRAAIKAADVTSVGSYPVTVHDPVPAPSGTDTQPVFFHVAAAVFDNYLPVTTR
jgi:hypothetical protein